MSPALAFRWFKCMGEAWELKLAERIAYSRQKLLTSLDLPWPYVVYLDTAAETLVEGAALVVRSPLISPF